ncbi:MAG: insulinase family protein [Vicinamibacterales bacterium]|nr:insulinase family protein [Vicinamibacterales bacterium]
MMRQIRFGAAFVVMMLAVGAAAAGAQPAPAVTAPALTDPLPLDPAIRTGTLSNGLRYFIKANGRPERRVSLRLAVNVGSMHEDEDQRGLAHFLEHMAFNGTRNFKPGELITFLESTGARFGPHVNAYTSFDETVYMLDVPTDRAGLLDRALLVLHDFAGGMLLDPEEIDKERGVVLEEWRGRLGAGSRLTDQQLPVLLKGSRYAERLPIGTPEVLKGFPHQRLRDFYERWYRPDQMALTVVGDVTVDEVEALIRTRLSDLVRPDRPIETPNRAVPPHAETLYSVATDPEAQGWTVSMVYKHPVEAQRTVGDYRRSLVRQLVFQMLNLRLRDMAAQPGATFLGAEAGADALGREVSLFQVGAAVPEGQLGPGLETLVREARRMAQFGFTEGELDRARRAVLAFYERAFNERETQESPGLAMELVRHFLEGEPVPGIAFEYRVASTYLPQVTLEEVATAARALVRDDNRVVVAVAPEKAGVPAPTDEAMRAAVARATAAPLEAYTDRAAGRALVPAPPAPGTVTARREIADIGVTVLTLSNGVEVWLKPTDFKTDQVLFTSYARGGHSLVGEAGFMEASLVTALVGTGGLGGFTPVDLTKMLSGQIAQASPSVSTFTHGISGSSTPRDLETALQLHYLAFTAPNLTPEALDLLQRRFTGLLENQRENPRFVFTERVQLVNSSGHYTGRAPTVEAIAALDLDVMQRFYRARFSNAGDFTYFLVGAFSVADVTPLVARWIGGLPSTDAAPSAHAPLDIRFPDGIVTEEVRKGREPASQTVMSFFADAKLDELEMHRARTVASLLTIRLRDILREELGGTYGVSVNYNNLLPQPGYGSITVSFGSAPENVATLTSAVLAEIERLRKEGPSPDDVARLQELERRELETSLRQNQYWLNSLQTVHLLGWDPAGIARRGARIEALTPALLHDAIRAYLPLDRYTRVTLLPEGEGQGR